MSDALEGRERGYRRGGRGVRGGEGEGLEEGRGWGWRREEGGGGGGA